MPTIEIFPEYGYGECDDCGHYSFERVKVLKDGEHLILDHAGDSHLGGGEWLNWEDAVREILTALGYTVKITEVDRGEY